MTKKIQRVSHAFVVRNIVHLATLFRYKNDKAQIMQFEYNEKI